MEQKTFWQYQKRVWSEAIRKTWDKFGVLGAFMGFIASGIAGSIIHLTQSRTDVNVGDVVITAAIFILLCVVAVVLYVAREPVIIYNKQVDQITERNNQIKELENKLKSASEQPDLQITPVKININKAGIQIENRTDDKITNLWVTLDELTLDSQRSGKVVQSIGAADHGFPYGEYFDEPGSILPRRSVLSYIAEARDQGIAFLLKQDYPFPYSDKVPDSEGRTVVTVNDVLVDAQVDIAEYKMRLSISGYWRDHHFNIIRIAHVHFQQGWNVTTLASITSLKELPSGRKMDQKDYSAPEK